MGEFGVLNWTILVVYILGNLVLGFYLSKNVHSADDYYLGNRATPWWAIGISVVATYVSALQDQLLVAGVFRTDPVIRVWV